MRVLEFNNREESKSRKFIQISSNIDKTVFHCFNNLRIDRDVNANIEGKSDYFFNLKYTIFDSLDSDAKPDILINLDIRTLRFGYIETKIIIEEILNSENDENEYKLKSNDKSIEECIKYINNNYFGFSICSLLLSDSKDTCCPYIKHTFTSINITTVIKAISNIIETFINCRKSINECITSKINPHVAVDMTFDAKFSTEFLERKELASDIALGLSEINDGKSYIVKRIDECTLDVIAVKYRDGSAIRKEFPFRIYVYKFDMRIDLMLRAEVSKYYNITTLEIITALNDLRAYGQLDIQTINNRHTLIMYHNEPIEYIDDADEIYLDDTDNSKLNLVAILDSMLVKWAQAKDNIAYNEAQKIKNQSKQAENTEN